MISKTRSYRDSRNPIGVLILLAAFAAAAGCSSASTTGSLVDASGNHPAGFVSTHPGPASPDGGACKECHGSDLRGGIVNVSCFSASRNGVACHASGPAGHPSGWAAALGAPQPHGSAARAANGFVGCQACHGTGTTPPANFGGGTSTISCYPCHVPTASSPHASAWRTGDTFVHTTTDPSNAQVCAQCHVNGASSPIPPPSPPAPAGTAPGCFNSTLCHGAAGAPHPVGSTWVATSPAAQPHGNSAKATPGATAGYAYCQDCHGTGTNFSGGSSGVSCYPCHGPTANSPHASQWRTGDTYVHTTTAAGNAPVCAFCHSNGANSPIAPPSPPAPAGTAPGCFNSTLCHGTGGVAHPVPYNDNSHYTVTSATFPGSCSACHDVSAPSTKVGPVCQTCHVAASPLAAANCTSCHASPPDGGAPAGAVYANIAGAHAVHIALNSTGSPVSCDTCHNGLGTGTLNHYNRANARPGLNALRVPPGDVAFLATYNAKTGASSFLSASLSCTNVSCHGGTSPPWQNSVIDVNTMCAICHAQGTTQFNSYASGAHTFHVNLLGANATTCAACHNTAALAVNHFTTLADNSISPAVAAATVGGAGTLITTWTPGAGTSGTCNAACHPGDRTW